MPTPLITEIQRFCLQDGPGIRTTIFLKGCPLHCPWCHNPENISSKQEFYFYANKCTGCRQCQAACSSGTGNMDHDCMEKTSDRRLCTSCLQCVSACRFGARETVGKSIPMENILLEAGSDRIFYEVSGGGVTISGGEPLMFPEFTCDLARSLKVKENLHVAVETCLLAEWHNIAPLLEYVDLFIVDIKSLDPEKHQRVTGGSLQKILSNLERLLEAKAAVRIHLPIIPHFNDSSEDFETYAVYLGHFAGNLSGVDILPFHSYAAGKYIQLGRSYQYQKVPDLAVQQLAPLVQALEQQGIREITIGGMVGASAAAENGVANRALEARRGHLPPVHLPQKKGVVPTRH
ncbi:glycyl-radical enzyme activating protein [Geotalea toluenoxydans]|uniref:glycyl-radical enzyme activating protein n=1 Tax=Geotalea toluenoxydans TaxID=421624 RepID=UPI0006CF38BF|nr:glycyl-radical enzyme activating protein [Geotalea toluenoxydans]